MVLDRRSDALGGQENQQHYGREKTPFLLLVLGGGYGDAVRRFRDGHHEDEPRETSRFVAVRLRGTPS